MGYVFEAIAKAERARRIAGRAAKSQLPEIQTLPIVPPLPTRSVAVDTDDAGVIAAPDSSLAAARRALIDEPAAQDLAPEHQPEAERLAPVSPLPLNEEAVARFDRRLVVAADPAAPQSEEYRSIRTQLLGRFQHRRYLVHVVTSSVPREGKTLTALNLGLALSELPDRQILVIEANLRVPGFDKLLGRESGPGLLQVMRGQAMLDDALQSVARGNLFVLSSGGIGDADATQLLASPVFADLLRRLRQRFDHILIDTPPALELSDAGVIGALADEVTLVVRNAATPRRVIEQTLRNLKAHRAPVSGVLLTSTPATPRRYRYGVR